MHHGTTSQGMTCGRVLSLSYTAALRGGRCSELRALEGGAQAARRLSQQPGDGRLALGVGLGCWSLSPRCKCRRKTRGGSSLFCVGGRIGSGGVGVL